MKRSSWKELPSFRNNPPKKLRSDFDSILSQPISIWPTKLSSTARLELPARCSIDIATSPRSMISAASNGMPTGLEQEVFRELTGAVSALAFLPDNRYLASGGWDRRIQIRDLETKHVILTLSNKNAPRNGVAEIPLLTRVLTDSCGEQTPTRCLGLRTPSILLEAISGVGETGDRLGKRNGI